MVTLIDLLGLHGGAERLALSIATRLNHERFESIMCVSRWPPSPPAGVKDPSAQQALELLEKASVRFLPLGRRRKIELRPWVRLERFLRRERVQVLHMHKFGSNAWGTPVGRMAHVPVLIAHEHTWSYEGQPLRRFLDRELIARGTDCFIAVSREDRRRMIEVEHIDPSRTLFIPNGVPPVPPASERDARVELGIEPDTPLIGVVGLLRPQKAINVLLHAISLLTDNWPDVQVLIVGDGPERENLERMARQLGVQDTVRFLGLRTDVPDLLYALDMAVCCSDFEGSPLSVMEYMSAALPVVATAVGGIPDLIEPGVHGLLVPPGDPPALAESLSELLRSPERARAMGVRGREHQRAEFDIDVIIRRVEDLYCEMLEKRGCPLPDV